MRFLAFLIAVLINFTPLVIYAGSQQVSSTTAQTIIDDARYYLNDTSEDFWTNEELMVWLNAGIVNIAARARCLDVTETINLVKDQLEYSITEDCVGVAVATYNEGKGLIKGSPASVGHCADLAESAYWYEWNDKVGIYPVYSGSSAADDLNTWISRIVGFDGRWEGICWSPELSLFCAVSCAGDEEVMTSPDGIIWTARSTPQENDWRAICWSPDLNLFCAVAPGGVANRQVITSPDGITWTIRTAAADRNWESICWSPGLGLFCAVSSETGAGNSDQVMTSPDGTTWTLRFAAWRGAWSAVCWSPDLGLLCAVTRQEGSGGSPNSNAMTSSDGITWAKSGETTNEHWASLCWSPGLGLFCSTCCSYAMTSPDGTTWTRYFAVEGSWSAVCWSPETAKFVATTNVTPASGKAVMSSPDGGNWTLETTPSVFSWGSVCWSPAMHRFVAVSYQYTPRVMTHSINFNSGQIDIFLAKRPSSVTLLTDLIPVPTHYDHLLTMYVTARALYSDNKYRKATRLMVEYREVLDRFRVDYNERIKEPREIVK